MYAVMDINVSAGQYFTSHLWKLCSTFCAACAENTAGAVTCWEGTLTLKKKNAIGELVWFVISRACVGLQPNQKLAAPPCFSVPERQVPHAAGDKRPGCRWASAAACGPGPGSEPWWGRAEAWPVPVLPSGKLLSSSWCAGNTASARQELSGTQKRSKGWGGLKIYNSFLSQIPQEGRGCWGGGHREMYFSYIRHLKGLKPEMKKLTL